MSETRHDNTKSTHCRDVGALSLEPPHRQGMQRSYETYSNRTWPFCWSNCTPHNPGHRNDKSYLFVPNHRCKRRSFARVDLRAAMFSIPLCAWVYSSGRLFHNLSRKHAGNPRVQNIMYQIRVVMFITKTEILIRYRTEPKRKSIRF